MEWTTVVMGIAQALMTVILVLLGIILKGFSQDMKEMRFSVDTLKEMVWKGSLSRDDFETYRKETRETIHRLTNMVNLLASKLAGLGHHIDFGSDNTRE
jgi:hypothetical protein